MLDPRTLPLSGTQLIEASAGTGKTHTITWLVLRLLLDRALRLDQILVVTFTQAATAELKTRIRRRLQEASRILGCGCQGQDRLLVEWLAARRDPTSDLARLGAALRNLDEAPIFTIHGFCQRVLEEHAFEGGARFGLELVAEVRPLLLELVQDFWAREVDRAGSAQVRYLREQKTSLASLLALAEVVTDWPTISVVPGAPLAADPERALADYHTARQAAARAWPEARDEVRQLLSSSAALNRSSYRPVSVELWLREFTGLLEETEPSITRLTASASRFTPTALSRASKQGAEPPTHWFFGLSAGVERAGLRVLEELEGWRRRFRQDFVAHVRRELGERKDVMKVRGFADLLHELAGALRGPLGPRLAKRIRAQYPAALIDEFQDTDPVQYEILHAVYDDTGGTLLLIGDPKQAIYGFRGADIFAYLRAAHRVPSDHRWTLRTSYRADPNLVQAINDLFGRVARPFLFDQIPYLALLARPDATQQLRQTPERPSALEFLWVPRAGKASALRGAITKRWAASHLAALVASEIMGLLASTSRHAEPIRPADIAVLTRTNWQAGAVQRALLEAGVPSVLQAQSSVLDSPEARDMAALLRALADPAGVSTVRTALATPLFGLTAPELFALYEDEHQWQSWVARFQDWHDAWQRHGFLVCFRRCYRDARIGPRLLSHLGGERRVTNVLHLAELLHTAATKQHLGMAGLLRWYAQVRHGSAAREDVAAEARQLRLETDEHAVQLVTLHKSKGLEYPIVICPYLWEGTTLRKPERELLRYHDPQCQFELKLDLRDIEEKPAELAQAEQEALAEQLRLLYVAVTRAKHRVIIVTGAFNSYEKSALAYLLHQPRDATEALPSPAVARRIRELDDAGLLADLQARAERASPAVAVRDIASGRPAAWQSEPREPEELSSSVPKRVLKWVWRRASFSQLVEAAPTGLSASVGFREFDEPPIASGTPRFAELSELAGSEWPRAPLPLPLHALPRGAVLGTLVHSVLQKLDFTRPERLESLIQEELARQPLLGALDTTVLAWGLGELLRLPLDAAGTLRLGELRPDQCWRELEFLLPIRGGRTSTSSAHPEMPATSGHMSPAGAATAHFAERAKGFSTAYGESRSAADRSTGRGLALAGGTTIPVTAQGLARAFARAAERPLVKRYAERVLELGFPDLLGHLRGFIDLVLVHKEQYFIIDYKTNDLGPHPEDYGPEQLAAAMYEHHYVLQYHLYAVALHRLLCWKIPGYSYQNHFGGVYYLFFRAIDGQFASGRGEGSSLAGPPAKSRTTQGVYFDRPPLRLIVALESELDAAPSDYGESP